MKIVSLEINEWKTVEAIIRDFEKVTGANLITKYVATMSSNKVECYHLLNSEADSTKKDNLISALLIVDRSGKKVKMACVGVYIVYDNNIMSHVALMSKKMKEVFVSKHVHAVKFDLEIIEKPETPSKMILATPSISNLSHKDGHLTGTIDVTVGGIFSWDVVKFDINLDDGSMDWWYID